MLLVRLLSLSLLLLASPAWAQPFTINQWQTYGSGYSTSLFRAASPPVDPYKTMVGGTNLTAGQTIREGTTTQGPLAAWNFSTGGIFDTDRERFIVTQSSGHVSSGTNEIGEFILSSGTWVRQMGPTVELLAPQNVSWPNTIAFPGGGSGFHLSGPLGLVDANNHYPTNVAASTGLGLNMYPNSGQQYGAVTYMPAPYRQLWTCGGVANWDSNFGLPIAFTWDTTTFKWQGQDAEFNTFGGGTGGCSAFPGGSVWDSTYQRVLFHDWNSIYQYNPAAPPGSRVTILVNNFASVNDETTAVWDPKRKRMLLFGGLNQRYYDFSAGPTSPTVQTFSWGVSGYPTHFQGQGVFYDPIADRYIFAPFDNTRTLISINPDTFVATDITPATGTTPPALGATGEHMYYRFFYVPSQDIYVALINPTDSTAFVYKPARPPVLAFTDIAQGPKTGNRDTSQGQTANVNGAIVTVWGYNLVGASFTINGAAPAATYYVGNATPPACGAANLYNQYQKLQCAILQVASTATSGAGTIVATVGGFTSNTLPFTVKTSGNIFFAGVGGVCNGFTANFSSIQTMLDSMDRLDIGYVCDGLNTPNGVNMPTPNTRFDHGVLTDPFAIVAYPGASVTVGDATHTGFALPFSGTGYGMVFAKFTAVADSNGGALNLRWWSRGVGNLASSPNMNSATGTGCVGGTGRQIFLFGNEITNCAPITAANILDHVVYFSGNRNPCPCELEENREIGWNYIHDNFAFRGVNIFNQGNGGADSDPVTGHNVHDNVIINQDGDAILMGRAVVGANSITNNLMINTGLNRVTGGWGTSTALPCINIQMSDPNQGPTPPHDPTVLTITNNTMLNCGANTGGSNGGVGVLHYGSPSGETHIFNNIAYQQSVSFPYVTTGSVGFPSSADATKYATNLWFGSGGAPSWDTSPVNSNPNLVAATGTYNLHLVGNSPAIGVGTNRTSAGFGLLDFDGLTRPASGAWDLGALQFAGSGATPAPPSSVTSSVTGKGSATGKGSLR